MHKGWKHKKGGKLNADYISKRNIKKVDYKQQNKSKTAKGSDLLDGVYVKKGKKTPAKSAKFTNIWTVENPFDLYTSEPDYKKAENAIKRGMRSGKITLKNVDSNEILENYKHVGADDSVARERIYLMLSGDKYEDHYAKGGNLKSLFSKAKKIGKKTYSESKKAVQRVNKQVKKKIATDVIFETQYKPGITKKETKHLGNAYGIVFEKYDIGGKLAEIIASNPVLKSKSFKNDLDKWNKLSAEADRLGLNRDDAAKFIAAGMDKKMKGGKMKQGYNARMDESLGNRTGRSATKKQTLKDRRDEAKGENKAVGKRAYQSVGTMDITMPEFFQKGGKIATVFDDLKKGDTVILTYGSAISRDNKATLNVRSKTRVGKGKPYEAEKITFINEANPKGVRFFAYKRLNGFVGFAKGDLALSVKSLDKTMKKGGDTWIQKSVDEMEKKGTVGLFTKKAKRAGMTTEQFMRKVLSSPERFTEKTRKEAQWMKNVTGDKMESGGNVATSVQMFNSQFRELNSKAMNADGHLYKAKQVLKKHVPALEKLYKELWEKIHKFESEGKDVKTLKLIAAKMLDSVQKYKGQLNFIEMYKHGGKMKQGYNDRDDESLGMSHRGSMKQSLKDRRDESKGERKYMGKRPYRDDK